LSSATPNLNVDDIDGGENTEFGATLKIDVSETLT
jgi:hypothetical protein